MYDRQQKTKKTHAARQDVSRAASGEVKRRVRHMAGLPERGMENRDPVSYVTDSFTRNFRAHGVAMSQLLLEQPDRTLAGERDRNLEAPRAEEKTPATKDFAPDSVQNAAEKRATGGMEQNYMQTGAQAEHGVFLHKFADVSFHKGTLAAGVLQGSGKVMLVSALKNAHGKSVPTNQRQRTVFGDSSAEQKVPQTDAVAAYNRGDVTSAVAMVTSSISSGSAMLQELGAAARLAQSGTGGDALYRAYPFLSTKEEHEAMREYRERLREGPAENAPENARDRAVLEYGEQKTAALLQHKQSMCKKFAGVLEELGAYAQRAELEFSDASAPDQILQALTETALDASGGADENSGDNADAAASAELSGETGGGAE